MSPEPFNLRQQRDLGQLVSGTFAILRKHGRPLYRAIALCCIPPLLLAAYFIGGGFGAVVAPSAAAAGSADARHAYVGMMVVGAYAIMLVLIPFLHALVHEFIRALDRVEETGISSRRLIALAARRLPHYAGILLLTGLMTFGAASALSFLMLLGEPVLAVAGALCMAGATVAIATFSALASSVSALERKGVLASVRRSFHLVQGDFWPTLGVSLLMGLIVLSIGYIVQLAGVLVMLALAFIGQEAAPSGGPAWAPVLFSVLFGFQFTILLLTYPLPWTCLALKHCSRVEEREGHGLRMRIDAFGEL